MTSYTITARKTSPVTPVVVEAESRELAIQQVVDQAAEGEQVEVLQCIETIEGEEPPVDPPVARSKKG
jgi:hypothetical protein